MSNLNRYKGEGLPPDGNKKNRFPYLADDSLVQAVNMSIALERPLLIKGPPGCGKTKLAYSIAHELGLKIHTWYVKSTSQAKDGLYTFDAIRRLHDAQLKQNDPENIWDYITFNAMGEAFRDAKESVVLIDEVDKADIDFPNDLLRELDEKQFEITELKNDDDRKIQKARSAPIVIITSNNERELPDAFLRRCLFYHISFPDKKRLIEIVNINMLEIQKKVHKRLIQTAIDRLLEMRDIEGFRKSPGTSELIDWVKVLHYWETQVGEIKKDVLGQLPHLGVLFKHRDDLEKLNREGEHKR